MATNPLTNPSYTEEIAKQLQKTLAEENKGKDPTSSGSDAQQPGDTVPATALATHMEQKPGAFTWGSQSERDQAWENWLNREGFSYDPESDPLYQQYKQQYMNLGQLAMQDTMGQAAALTGGYGSSYAQTAGQQAYQSYLQRLNDVIPELYGAAYDRYQAEGEALYNEALAYENLRQQAYGEYQDGYDRWNTERDYLTDRQNESREALMEYINSGYTPTAEEVAAAGMTQAQAQALVSKYQKEQNAARRQALLEQIATGYEPTAEELAAVGLTEAEAQAAASEYQNERQAALREELLEYIAVGYEPTAEELAAAGITEAQAQAAASKYQNERQAALRKELLDYIEAGYDPTDAELAAAGMTRKQAWALAHYYEARQAM